MGKHPDLSAAELEFIFQQFAKGLSNKEVMEEIMDTEFTKRCSRTMSSLRRNFEAARKVLKIQLEKEINPLVAKRKGEHYSHLAKISLLLVKDISGIFKDSDYKPSKPSYEVVFRDGEVKIMTQKELADYLQEQADTAISTFGIWDVDCLAEHMKEDFPELVSESFFNGVEKRPYEVITTLLLLSRKKIFKGKCPVCQDWP